MPTRSVELTEHLDEFINDSVSSGRFGDANELVGEGLRLLEEREREDAAKLEWLRAAAREAFDSLDRREGIAFESMDDLSAFLDKIGEEALAEIAAERRG